jgi:hypothetical protein
MTQLWHKHGPNMPQLWSNHALKHTRAPTRARARTHLRARSRRHTRLLGGVGDDLRTLVAPHYKTPLTRVIGRCHMYTWTMLFDVHDV